MGGFFRAASPFCAKPYHPADLSSLQQAAENIAILIARSWI
jgi:hypothetical protein